MTGGSDLRGRVGNRRSPARAAWAWLAAACVFAALSSSATLASPDVALSAGDPPPAVTARAFEIRHRPLFDAADIVAPILSEAGTVSLEPRLRRLIVQDRPDVVERIAEMLADFDVPPRSVEVTVSLFLATDKRDEEAGRHAQSPEVTREIRGVRETLVNFSNWKDYAPLGSATVVSTEGSRVTVDLAEDYQVVYRVDGIDAVQGRERVTFGEFTLRRAVRTASGEVVHRRVYTAEIMSLTPGRKIMVGASQSPESPRALFVSISADPQP